MTNIILGGGIVGAVCAHYHPDFTIMTRLGDDNEFPLGPQYLYKTKETEQFLNELGLDTTEKTIHVGYWFDGKFQKPSVYAQEQYYRKTRGYGLIDLKSMSERKTSFTVFAISFNDIIKNIMGNRDVMYDGILFVDLDTKKLIGHDNNYYFDTLISTIPLPSFLELCGMLDTYKKQLNYNTIMFSYVKDTTPSIWQNDYDYIYYPDPELPFYRITKMKYPYCVYEYIETPTLYLRSDKYLDPYVDIIRNKKLEYGKIIADTPPDLSKHGMEFHGRYAEWRPNMMVHDLIKELQRRS